MAYILAVNPGILSLAGMDRGALVTVTAMTAAIATLLMAFLTNYPIALALAGMGTNAPFTPTYRLGNAPCTPGRECVLGMVFINGAK